MIEYQFRPIGKSCAGTGQEFQPGERCHCVVVERDGQFTRLDYSAAGWKGPPEGTVGEWISQIPAGEPKPKTIDTESLLQFFEQLCEDPNPAHDQQRYVLALLLLQKRRLRLEDSRTDDDGNEFLQLIGSKSEGPFEIADQHLSEVEIAQMQAALTAQLAAEVAA